MKTAPQGLLDLIPNPKTVNARATFRVTRPQFTVHALTDSLGITDPTQIDSCAYGTGILRVTNYNNFLYTQNVSDIGSAWPSWVNTTIALYPGSRPGADGGYVWYQKADGNIAFRNFAAWTTETVTDAYGDISARILAPIANLRCYATSKLSGTSAFSIFQIPTTGPWVLWPGRVYDITLPRLDAVHFSDGIDGALDYIYFTDRDAGRVIEMSYHVDGKNWGQRTPIVAIDAIADDYGVNLNGASIINGNLVVTGRMTRTSDGANVSMDIYLIGPENFSLGRDMYISSTAIGGPMLVVGTQLLTSGCAGYATATITNLFGVDTSSLKLLTSDIVNLRIEEAENRSSILRLALSPALSHAAIASGSQVVLEICHNTFWMTVLTGEINHISRSNSEGQDLLVDVISSTAKRINQWAPEQGIYIPSQASVICNATDLSQMIRADGNFTEVPAGTRTPLVKYDDTNAGWNYSAGWNGPANNVPAAYNNTYHYSNSVDPTVKAEFTFTGNGFNFYYLVGPDRGLHEIWIDGVKITTINAQAGSAASACYNSPALTPGTHTFKLMHGAPIANYICVDAFETVSITDVTSYLTPQDTNKWDVLYTAARAARGGVMRARFFNEADTDATKQNPRFGVGLNYYRESAVEAAARLGLNYEDVSQDLCGHNGIVAIYSRTEHGGTPGIALYSWKNSVMTLLISSSVTDVWANFWSWLQISFVEGAIKVDYRLNGTNSFTNAITYSFPGTSPWANEQMGHGCIVMQRQCPLSLPCGGISELDTTLGLLSVHTTFPASGQVVVDDEIMTYSAKSTYNSVSEPSRFLVWRDTILPISSFSSAGWMPSYNGDLQAADHSYIGAAAIFYGQAASRWTVERIIQKTSRLSDFCSGYHNPHPSFWHPTNGWVPGWTNCIGDTTKGSWISDSWEYDIYYFDDNPADSMGQVVEQAYGGIDFGYSLLIRPGLYISSRGVNSVATSHVEGKAYLYFNIDLRVDQVEYFSQDEDVTLADALGRILSLSGGKYNDNKVVDQDFTMPIGTICTPVSGVGNNFVADLLLPSAAVPVNGVIGIDFRCSLVPAPGTYLHGDGNQVFVNYSNNAWSLVYTRIANGTNAKSMVTNLPVKPVGKLRISAQDNHISVWLNHQLIVSVACDVVYTSTNMALRTYAPSTGPTSHMCISEISDLMADITVGTRGKGMNVIGEMTQNRKVFFRNDADGSMFFFKTPTSAGTIPDIVISDDHEWSDDRVSRVRTEGILISEIADFTALQAVGNLFETTNSMWANTIKDLEDDGTYYMKNIRQRSEIRTLETVMHPALQPGDLISVPLGGVNTSLGIIATQTALGFNGDQFDVQEVIQVYTP